MYVCMYYITNKNDFLFYVLKTLGFSYTELTAINVKCDRNKSYPLFNYKSQCCLKWFTICSLLLITYAIEHLFNQVKDPCMLRTHQTGLCLHILSRSIYVFDH